MALQLEENWRARRSKRSIRARESGGRRRVRGHHRQDRHAEKLTVLDADASVKIRVLFAVPPHHK